MYVTDCCAPQLPPHVRTSAVFWLKAVFRNELSQIKRLPLLHAVFGDFQRLIRVRVLEQEYDIAVVLGTVRRVRRDPRSRMIVR